MTAVIAVGTAAAIFAIAVRGEADAGLGLGAIVGATLGALAFAVAGSAGVAFLMARSFARRVDAITAEASRYRSGDLTPSAVEFGEDELGAVGRAMDQTVRELATRNSELV